MDTKNKQRRFVETPVGRGWLEDVDQNGKYYVVITHPSKDYKHHRFARLAFYPEQIKEVNDE